MNLSGLICEVQLKKLIPFKFRKEKMKAFLFNGDFILREKVWVANTRYVSDFYMLIDK
jgi:hypothetical protein